MNSPIKKVLSVIIIAVFIAGCAAQVATVGPQTDRLTNDPYNLDRSPNIEGVDTNNDGVRDDIAAIIDAYPFSASQKRAFMQGAAALQAALISSTDKSKAIENAIEMNRASECIFNSFTSLADFNKYFDEIEALTVNTEARVQAYIRFEKLTAGVSPSEPTGAVCK